MKAYVVPLAVTALLFSSAAYGEEIWFVGQAAVVIPNPSGATAPPGTPFTFDFRPGFPADRNAPYQVGDLLLCFQCSSTTFSNLKVQLGPDPAIYSYVQEYPTNADIYYYDAAFGNHGTGLSIPQAVIPQGWKDELADGVVEGRLWLEGAVRVPQNLLYQASGVFAAPEPAISVLLAFGAAALLRKRSRNRP